MLRTHVYDVCVFDPGISDAESEVAIEEIRAIGTAVPLIAYTELTSRAMHACVHVARVAPLDVVLVAREDRIDKLRRRLEAGISRGLGQRVLDELRERLQLLPQNENEGIEALFAGSADMEQCAQEVRALRAARRSIDRRLARAQLNTVRAFGVAANVLRAYCILRSAEHSPRLVARRAGFSSERALTRAMLAVTGQGPARAQRMLSGDDIVRNVVRYLRRGLRGSPDENAVREA